MLGYFPANSLGRKLKPTALDVKNINHKTNQLRLKMYLLGKAELSRGGGYFIRRRPRPGEVGPGDDRLI